MYKEGAYCGCDYRVDESGDCYTRNGKGEYIHRSWRYNSDGYPVVSACGIGANSKKIQRSLQVHILVAREFVDGWFDGAEVNHKDFNRSNPAYWNLEWVSHKDNIRHSCQAGRYMGKTGINNPNYGNDALHRRYIKDKEFAKEKQSRPRGQNGKAKKCVLYNDELEIEFHCDCLRDAVDLLVGHDVINAGMSKEYVIKRLKDVCGYKDWHISIIH